MDIDIYSASKEMMRAAISANREDVLTGTVAFGFSSSEETEPTTWTNGTWYSNEQTVENIDGKYVKAYVAQVLVSGPGGGGAVELAEGEHFAFTRVTMPDNQAIVKFAGKVTVL